MFLDMLVLGSMAALTGAGSAFAASPWDPEQWSVLQLIQYHQSQERDMEVQDAYKMLVQADIGEHHVKIDSMRSSLKRELDSLQPAGAEEPLLQRIGTNDEMMRVNLRPFKARNLDPKLLLRALVNTRRGRTPDSLKFFREWNEFCSLVRYGLLNFPSAEVEAWDVRVRSGELPAVPHSEAYTHANRPAYRVVRRSEWEKVFGSTVPGPMATDPSPR